MAERCGQVHWKINMKTFHLILKIEDKEHLMLQFKSLKTQSKTMYVCKPSEPMWTENGYWKVTVLSN